MQTARTPEKGDVSVTRRDTHRHLRSTPARDKGARIRIAKFLMLLLMLAIQPLAYKVLTEARYEGQGLVPHYLRLTTVSDLLSLVFSLIAIGAIVIGLAKPRRISLSRTIMATVFSVLLLWLDFGVRRIESSEFSPFAAVALLISMCSLLAILLTNSRPFLSPGRRIYRIVRNTFAVFLVLASFAFLYSFLFPNYTDLREIQSFNPDGGVVLGAAVWRSRGLGDRPSPTLRERIEVGYDLLTKQAIPRLIVTGASAPGEQAEAEVAKEDLIRRGVDEVQIVEETASHTTLEQVRYLRENLEQTQGWSRFVIISDQYHLARVIEMCRFNGLHAIGSPSRISQPFIDLLYYRVRESVALLAYWLLGK